MADKCEIVAEKIKTLKNITESKDTVELCKIILNLIDIVDGKKELGFSNDKK